MKLRRLASALLLLIGVASVASQTVKEVMLDKSGTYLFAQSRDADIDVAFKTAQADLLTKIRDYCRAHDIPAPTSAPLEPDGPVKRIDGEALGQHRVFLYLETASITTLPTTSNPQKDPTPPSPPKAPIPPKTPNPPTPPKLPKLPKSPLKKPPKSP